MHLHQKNNIDHSNLGEKWLHKKLSNPSPLKKGSAFVASSIIYLFQSWIVFKFSQICAKKNHNSIFIFAFYLCVNVCMYVQLRLTVFFFVWLKVTIPLKMWFILNVDSGPVYWPRVSKTNMKTLTVFCLHDSCHWLDHSRLGRSAEYYVRRVMGIILHLLPDPITPHRLSPQRTGQRLPSQ